MTALSESVVSHQVETGELVLIDVQRWPQKRQLAVVSLTKKRVSELMRRFLDAASEMMDGNEIEDA